MYTLTSVLFAVLSLILPTLAVPVSVLDDINGLEKRTADYLGKVRVICFYIAHDTDLSARRQPIFTLTLEVVVNTITIVNSSSLFPRNSMIMIAIAGRFNTPLIPNTTTN